MANEALEKLIAAWKDSSFAERPYILPEDDSAGFLNEEVSVVFHSFDSFVDDPKYGETLSGCFHTGLLPEPYLGDLRNAKVLILMGNPGFEPLDYYAEATSDALIKAKRENVRQDFSKTEFPNFFLDPKFSWHGGAQYWLQKFAKVIERLDGTYRSKLQRISRNVAVAQYLPYHSMNMSLAPRKELESTRLVKAYAHEAQERGVLIVCLRKKKDWEFDDQSRNFIVGRTRAAHLPKDAVSKIVEAVHNDQAA